VSYFTFCRTSGQSFTLRSFSLAQLRLSPLLPAQLPGSLLRPFGCQFVWLESSLNLFDLVLLSLGEGRGDEDRLVEEEGFIIWFKVSSR